MSNLGRLPPGRALAPFFSSGCRTPDQEIGRLNFEHRREPTHHVDAGGADAALDCADIGPNDLRSMRELLLCHLHGGCRRLPQISREDLLRSCASAPRRQSLRSYFTHGVFSKSAFVLSFTWWPRRDRTQGTPPALLLCSFRHDQVVMLLLKGPLPGTSSQRYDA